MAARSSGGKIVTAAVSGLVALMSVFFLTATDSLAQSRTSESYLSRLASKSSNSIKVSFSYSPRFPKEGQIVQFVESSSGGPTSWRWDFGDGTGGTDRNPIHLYTGASF